MKKLFTIFSFFTLFTFCTQNGYTQSGSDVKSLSPSQKPEDQNQDNPEQEDSDRSFTKRKNQNQDNPEQEDQ